MIFSLQIIVILHFQILYLTFQSFDLFLQLLNTPFLFLYAILKAFVQSLQLGVLQLHPIPLLLYFKQLLLQSLVEQYLLLFLTLQQTQIVILLLLVFSAIIILSMRVHHRIL